MINSDTLFGRLGNRMFQMAYIYAQMKKGIVKDIYCQDFTLFEEYKDEIKQWFGEGIGYLPYVAIHVRRGDYVGNSFYCQLWETGYYIDAINQFPNRKFIIFSDDIKFCKIYFEGDKFAFDDSKDEIEAFNKMASCDGHIIANSSFSSWAAYLSSSKGKIIAPTIDKWYADGVDRITLPKHWIRV